VVVVVVVVLSSGVFVVLLCTGGGLADYATMFQHLGPSYEKQTFTIVAKEFQLKAYLWKRLRGLSWFAPSRLHTHKFASQVGLHCCNLWVLGRVTVRTIVETVE